MLVVVALLCSGSAEFIEIECFSLTCAGGGGAARSESADGLDGVAELHNAHIVLFPQYSNIVELDNSISCSTAFRSGAHSPKSAMWTQCVNFNLLVVADELA